MTPTYIDSQTLGQVVVALEAREASLWSASGYSINTDINVRTHKCSGGSDIPLRPRQPRQLAGIRGHTRPLRDYRFGTCEHYKVIFT